MSSEKLSIIDRELKRLGAAEKHSTALRREGLVQASERSPEGLRGWMRQAVVTHNANEPSTDPFAESRKRHLIIGTPDTDGGSFVRGYLPALTTALLEAALAPARNPGYLPSVPADRDTRGLKHRRVDALHHLLRKYHQDKTERNDGVGSLVVSLSIKDVVEMTPHSRFPTNTHSQLKPMDVLLLGAAKYDFGVVHDEKTGAHCTSGELLAPPASTNASR